MKKTGTDRLVLLVFACAILVSLVSGYAIADLIWEPNDDFYRAHTDECDYVNRDYYANGENGYLELFIQPGGKSLGFADNGEPFHVQFSYTVGNTVWGVVECSEKDGKFVSRDGDYQSAWIDLKDATLKYDTLSFDEDHSSEYTAYTGDYTELKAVPEIMVWTFPNSGERISKIDYFDENFQIAAVYSDLSGVQWGKIGYFYGIKNFWVCLSAPGEIDLPAKDLPVIVFNSPSPDSEPEPTGSDITTVLIICVAAAILISAVLISLMNKKRKNNT